MSAGQVKVLERIKGIGKKTAQRVILELKQILVLDEDETAATTWGPRGEDAIRALLALGYSPTSAQQMVRRALETLPAECSLEDIVKLATRSVRVAGG